MSSNLCEIYRILQEVRLNLVNLLVHNLLQDGDAYLSYSKEKTTLFKNGITLNCKPDENQWQTVNTSTQLYTIKSDALTVCWPFRRATSFMHNLGKRTCYTLDSCTTDVSIFQIAHFGISNDVSLSNLHL